MIDSARTFRVFVSSTFADLQDEREALRERVVPRLQAELERRGCRLQWIDLRWGVSDEAAQDNRTMRICLSELQRCQRTSPRPNFVVLLGERYGWRPLPEVLDTREYDAIHEVLTPEERALAARVYRRDDNAVPPEVVLLPRTGDWRDPTRWRTEVEERLGRAFARAADELPLSEGTRVRLCASATEQEILAGALAVPDARDHVAVFARVIEGLPAGASAVRWRDQDAAGRPDTRAAEDRMFLEARLRAHLGDAVRTYRTRWLGDRPAMDHLDALCADVHAHLWRVIEPQLAANPPDESRPALEIAEHRAEADRRVAEFTGREEEMVKLLAAVERASPQPLLVTGPSGIGKSSLLAAASRHGVEGPHSVTLLRFVGLTPESSDSGRLAGGLARELAECLRLAWEPGPRRDEWLAEVIRLVPSDARVRLFVVGLHRLVSEPRHGHLRWIPPDLPRQVSLVLSADEGGASMELAAYLPEAPTFTLGRLSANDASALLGRWLTAAGRTLTREQRAAAMRTYEPTGLPIALWLAFEEVRHWRSFETVPGAPAQVGQVAAGAFLRMASEAGHGRVLVARTLAYLDASRHGLSEYELSELLARDTAVLADVRRRSSYAPRGEALPPVVWSRLWFDLAPFLVTHERDGVPVLRFYHDILQLVAVQALVGPDEAVECRRALADYFLHQPAWFDEDLPNVRRASVLPYQLAVARRYAELNQLLVTPEFVVAKCAANAVDDLCRDYRRATALLTAANAEDDQLEAWAGFVTRHQDLLRRGDGHWHAGRIVAQLALEPETSGAVRRAIGAWLARERPRWSSLHRTTSERRDRQIRMFSGPRLSVAGVERIDDRRVLAWSDDWTMRMWDVESGETLAEIEHPQWHSGTTLHVTRLGDRHAVTRGDGDLDRGVRVWDLETGRQLRVVHHAGAGVWVEGAIDLDEGHLLTWSDRELCLWADAGRELAATVPAEEAPIEGVRRTSRTRLVVWYRGGVIRRMRRNGRDLDTVAWHRGPALTDLVALEDGTLVTWSSSPRDSDHRVRLWRRAFPDSVATLAAGRVAVRGVDPIATGLVLVRHVGGPMVACATDDGRAIASFEGHQGTVLSVRMLPPDRLVTGAEDGDVRVWNVADRHCEHVLRGHHGPVQQVGLARCTVSAGSDGSLRLWDAASGRSEGVLLGHTAGVRGFMAWPGERLLSWSSDRTIRLWDISQKPNADTPATRAGIRRVVPAGRSVRTAWHLRGGAVVALDSEGWIHTSPGAAGSVLRTWPESRPARGGSLLPDGRFISWSIDGDARLWNPAEGSCLARMSGAHGRTWGIEQDVSGVLVTWGEDCKLRVWSADGQLLRTVDNPLGGFGAVTPLPGGACLLTGEGQAGLLNPVTGAISRLTGEAWSIGRALLANPGGLVTQGPAGTMRSWSLHDPAKLVWEWTARRLTHDRAAIWGAGDQDIRIVRPRDGHVVAMLPGVAPSVIGVASLSGDAALTWTPSGVFKVWNGEGECVGTVDMVRTAPPSKGRVLEHAGRRYEPAGASAAPDGTTYVWYVSGGRDAHGLPEAALIARQPPTPGSGAEASEEWRSLIWIRGSDTCELFGPGGQRLFLTEMRNRRARLVARSGWRSADGAVVLRTDEGCWLVTRDRVLRGPLPARELVWTGPDRVLGPSALGAAAEGLAASACSEAVDLIALGPPVQALSRWESPEPVASAGLIGASRVLVVLESGDAHELRFDPGRRSG